MTLARRTALLALLLSAPLVAHACPAPPKPVRDLDIPRFYADKAGATVDAKLAKQHDAAVEPLVTFLRAIVDAADKAAQRNDAAQAACALSWLQSWATGDAWLGDMVTQQAEYQRKWDLAGVSLAYLKLKPFARDAAQTQAIEAWLRRWEATARAFFDAPARRRNNHWYWLGLATAGTALATDSASHWAAARTIFLDALSDIQPDGLLPLEMERQERALFYHVFAMTPLVVMAELAARRGEDWYGLEGGALHRLVALCLKGLAAPDTFARLAGKPQEQPVNARAGWLSLYRSRFPERVPTTGLPAVPDRHRWLGGDVRVLMRAVDGRR